MLLRIDLSVLASFTLVPVLGHKEWNRMHKSLPSLLKMGPYKIANPSKKIQILQPKPNRRMLDSLFCI
jgi:hypothetical protein